MNANKYTSKMTPGDDWQPANTLRRSTQIAAVATYEPITMNRCRNGNFKSSNLHIINSRKRPPIVGHSRQRVDCRRLKMFKSPQEQRQQLPPPPPECAKSNMKNQFELITSLALAGKSVRKTWHSLQSLPLLLPLLSLLILTMGAPRASNCDIICPKDISPMYPCSCQNGTQGLLIKCTHSNLATLANSLKNLPRQQPIEQVEIENSSVTRLWGPLFSLPQVYSFHSSLRELAVRASQVKSIDASSFSQQLFDNIQYLILDRNHLSHLPINLLAGMVNLRMLNISSNSIVSIEGNSFNRLTNLTELDLSQNKISRLAKGAFNSLNSLEYLNLMGNELSKLDRNLFSFGRRLRHLDVSNNKLTSLDRQDFNELTALETLRLANNQLTTLPRSIFSRNAKLYTLDLSQNKLEDIDTYLFKSTRFLKDLNMAGNSIKEITKNTFSPTTRIKRINMSSNLLQALGPETFRGLEWLEKLDLSHNQIVNISNDAFSRIFQVDIDLSHNKLTRIFYWAFREVSNVTKLDLSHNLLDEGVSPIAFESTDCAHLDLSHNLLQDLSKFPISNLTGLRTLDLRYNQITELNKKSFTQKTPLYELHTIDASHNNISQITGNVLERLKSIRTLDLSYNSLRRLTSGGLGGSPTLLELNLSNNNLVDIVAGTLVGLVSMRSLDLSYNRLKKMIPVPVALNSINLQHNEIGYLSRVAFPALNSLLELHLDHNRISSLEEGTFATLLALHTLSLSANNLSSIPVAALKDLTSLQTLRLDGNNIQRLHRKAFGTLPIVFDLLLSHNNISSIANHAFEGMLQLIRLDLSHNSLIELPPEAFASLVSLQKLNLAHNQLLRFENKTRSAMEDLLSLEVANFSSNKLSLITQRSFLNSPYIPYRLTQLDLSNNLIGVLVNNFVGGLRRLEWLSLRHNIINEIFPNVLGNMTHLRYLDLSHNKLRTLKEETFDGRLVNLTTILLNNNRLTGTVPSRQFDKLRSLESLDLSSNKLDSIFGEANRWIRRGVQLDLRNNQLECTCQQLPMIAWLDSFRARNTTYTTTIELQRQQQLLLQSAASDSSGNQLPSPQQQQQTQVYDRLMARNQLTPKLLGQYLQSVRIVAETNCAKPDVIQGRPIMQMLELVSSSSLVSAAAPPVIASDAFNCDRDLLQEADLLRRLRAPIQFSGAEPYIVDGQQHLRVGWTLHDSQLDLINFVLLKARFKHPFELSSFKFHQPPSATTTTTTMTTRHRANYLPNDDGSSSSGTNSNEGANDSSNDLQLIEQSVHRIPYNEHTFILRDLDPSQFYVVCITYETSEYSSSLTSSSNMIDRLHNSSTANEATKSALFANILADYNRINCIDLKSLLHHHQDTSERLISGVTHKPTASLTLPLLILTCQLVATVAANYLPIIRLIVD